ncbi:9896_t:CDS:1, partial [Funneliformis geosporum]
LGNLILNTTDYIYGTGTSILTNENQSPITTILITSLQLLFSVPSLSRLESMGRTHFNADAII